MYQFILNMWILSRVDEDFVIMQYNKGRITEEEKNMILATPRKVIK